MNKPNELPANFWEELPRPLYWRLLVRPIEAVTMSKGGIALPESSQEAQDTLNYMGQVVALGALAGKSERLGTSGDGVMKAEGFPGVGDHIIYGRYSGQRVTYKNVKLLWINDDEILGTVPNPDTLQVII